MICKKRSPAGTTILGTIVLFLFSVLFFTGCHPEKETVKWNEYIQVGSDITQKGLDRCLTIGRAQTDMGLRINIEEQGVPFFDKSFGSKHKMGCPFVIDSRKKEIRDRVDYYAERYRDAGLDVDFIFADWEIDDPLETNGSFMASKRCTYCRHHLGDEPGFEEFQRTMRTMRSYLQFYEYSTPILSRFPEALIGNYGVYPGDGYRKWYDEFPATGYTCAMPVVYTWYPIFNWYDFENPDYRWFYNMLLVGSNAGKSTPRNIPIVAYVTWHTVWVKFGGGYRDPDPATLQMSEECYQELLWHMILRGTDTFKVYSAGIREFPKEARLVHEVYAAAQQYGEFLEKGSPINFDVPAEPGTVVSGLLLDDRVLMRRTDFGSNREPVEIMAGTTPILVEYSPGRCSILDLDEYDI